MKERNIMSASVNGSDKQTLLDATHGLGFVEGRCESAVSAAFTATVCALSPSVILFNVDQKYSLA